MLATCLEIDLVLVCMIKKYYFDYKKYVLYAIALHQFPLNNDILMKLFHRFNVKGKAIFNQVYI